jgi:hypothetical protein
VGEVDGQFLSIVMASNGAWIVGLNPTMTVVGLASPARTIMPGENRPPC